jgi:putative transposase
MVERLIEDYPIATVCRVLDYPRSQMYYQAHPPPADEDLKPLIVNLAGQYPTYGYRRITAQLKRHGRQVNHKRVARLMAELNLMGKPARKRKRTTNSTHPFQRYPNLVMNLAIVHPNQVWVADITYIKLQQEFVYLAA